MSVRSRSYIFFTIAVLVASLALTGCPKKPEVTQAGAGAIGPGAATDKPATATGSAPGGDVQVPPRPGTESQAQAQPMSPSQSGPMTGGPSGMGPGGGPITATPGPGGAGTGSGSMAATAPGATASPLQDVFFEFDKATVRDDQKEALNQNLAWLKRNSQSKITVEGHCDERGATEYNLALGERRAKAVKDYLVAAGVPADRLATVSYGEERPFVLGHDESAWKWNRRGHFVISR
jgi:peptidoglycan-associated lipoprotein